MRQPRVESGVLDRIGPAVSLCMIVRDNAVTIESCLGGVSRRVNDVVVLDTGSSDSTPQITQQLGARVFSFPWCDEVPWGH